MRVPAEKPEAFRTAGGGAADSGLEQQDACKDQSKLPHFKPRILTWPWCGGIRG
jgi:hypothetical protein